MNALSAVGNLAYKLQLLETMHIHNVFHDSLLTPYCNDDRALPLPPSDITDDEPSQSGKFDRILDQTVIKHKTTSQLQNLIRFLGYGPEHDVWLDNVSNCSAVVKKY